MGWEIYAEESADHAAKIFHKAHLREGIGSKDLILHSDNGSPMKGATMLGMLQKLGVVPSFSRPSVSNDNPYSESLFKTMKYRPDFPERWASTCRNWDRPAQVTLNHTRTSKDYTILELKKVV